jgi:hypothetical protein
MTQDELDALIAQHGGVTGKVAQGPATEVDPDALPAKLQRAIPDVRRPHQINFKDGAHIVVKANLDDKDQPTQDEGGNDFEVVKPLTEAPKKANPDDAPTTRLDGNGNLLQWNKASGQWEAVDASGAKVSTEEADAKKQKAIQDKAEREYNSTHPDAQGHAYYATHAEVAAMQQAATSQSLTQAQIDTANGRLQADNRRLDQTITNETARTGIDQQNANTANSREDRLAKAAQQSADAQTAASALAAQRLDLDKRVQDHAISSEDAQLEYKKSYDAVQQQAAAARLALDTATEQNRVEDAARTDATTRYATDTTAATAANQQAETTAHDTATEGQQQLDEAGREGIAGADTATRSLPFMAPHGTSDFLNQIEGGMLKNPMSPTAPPPVPGQPMPWDPTTLVHDMTARALQGQSAYASRYVRQAGPNRPANTSPPVMAAPAAAAAPAAPGPQATAPAATPPATVGSPSDQQVEQYADQHQISWDDARAQMTAAPDAPTPADDAPVKAGATVGKAANTIINLHFNAPMGSPSPSDPNLNPRGTPVSSGAQASF